MSDETDAAEILATAINNLASVLQSGLHFTNSSGEQDSLASAVNKLANKVNAGNEDENNNRATEHTLWGEEIQVFKDSMSQGG